MKTEIDLDAIVIDGARLKAAREERGASVADMSAAITLSREQIKHIEDGGSRPFYTAAHKLLAVRKYATALDIPYDEVVSGPGADQTLPVPEDAPVSMMIHAESPEPTDLRLAAVERNAEVRRLMTLGAIALCIVLAVYAKLRGSPDEPRSDEPAPLAEAVEVDEKPARTKSPAPVATPAPAVAAAMPEPTAKPAATATPAAAASSQTRQDNQDPAPEVKVAAVSADDCTARAGSEPKTWSPAYQRKADSRLYLISPKGGSLCIVDASGKASLVTLKPMAGQAFSGKPPYVVRSGELAKIEIYMQGLRVKIPTDADALKLIPTSQPAPAAQSESPDT